MEDHILIEKVLAGDSNAFSGLIDRYKDMVYTLAIRIVKNNEDAEEVAQDSFIKAFEKLDSFKGSSKFSTWLYTIVYRTALTKVRKKKVDTADIDAYVMDNYTEGGDTQQLRAIQSQEQQKYVQEAMARLSGTDALVITLFYMEDHSIEEIMEVTEMSQSNVKVR